MQGLSSNEAAQRLAQNGPNELQEKKRGGIVALFKALSSPASIMLAVASALSFFIHRDFDGWFILSLLALNVGITLWHSHKADRALEELRSQLSVAAKVLRDGAWKMVPSRELVVGDVISCSVGSLISADARIEKAVNLEINEAVLTGESMPKAKKPGDTAYSGSVVVTGSLEATVTATGNNAFFGKVASSGEEKRSSSMERDILSITRFLIISSIIAIAILSVAFVLSGLPIADTAILDLSLLIAGLPVSLPTVMTLIVSIGALAVAAKKALVRRLSSLEDFANVTLLLTDKTGTLTENKISVDRFRAYAPFDEAQTRTISAAAASSAPDSIIDRAIAAMDTNAPKTYRVVDSVPADSVRKRSTTLLEHDGKRFLVTLGTPPIVASLCSVPAASAEALAADVAGAARDGSRAIAIAMKEHPEDIKDEKGMQLVGSLVLADPLRADAADTLRFLKDEGVNAIMVTGDTKETAAHVAQILGLEGKVVRPKDTDIAKLPFGALDSIAAFAEVMPDDKLKLVKRAQERYAVAATGDGVNDLPAVRKADVGVAVANAVDALKGTADLVLLASGISVMKTALVEARKIFFRLYNYSIYRISESFRLIVTALVLGLIIKGFPLTPIELILLAFLNDIPIITLAFDRVKRADRPADLRPRERFSLGTMFGLVGVANSLCMYFFLANFVHLPIGLIQTAFFLKLTVSGHMLIYVAHTEERWWRYLPAPSVIVATALTQITATGLAVSGIFVTAIPFALAIFVWFWAFFWMQVTEAMKAVQASIPALGSIRLPRTVKTAAASS